MAAETGPCDHPLRRRIVGEMHLRRFPSFDLPACILQLVRIVSPAEREEEGWRLSAGAARHGEIDWAGGVTVGWERHSEATTITVASTALSGWEDDGADEVLRWALALPGSVIRATRVLVVADDAAAGPLIAAAGFAEGELVSCHIAGGLRLWSDFRIHDDGFGRLVVAANGAPTGDVIRCVQRLQELGNYRNLALLGLPAAQDQWPALDRIEASLDVAGRGLVAGMQRDDELLARFSVLSADLLSVASQCGYRLAATAAYAEIVSDRLRDLAPIPIPGFQSLSDFTARRFYPAVRTCAALGRRIETLNRRCVQFTTLLRTRIETHIENQNGQLLRSMDRSARLQLRLQHLVEGLSVIAVSYYALGLLGYPVKAAEKLWPGVHAATLMGIAAPAMLLLVFLMLRRLRHGITDDNDNDPSPSA